MLGISNMSNTAIAKACHEDIPPKVAFFIWRLFQNKIAMKENLCKRQVLDQNSSQCDAQCNVEESVSHLFFESPVFASL